MSDLKTLEEKYKALGEEIERLKNKPVERFWKPAKEDKYIFIAGGYKVVEDITYDMAIDRLRIDAANCYRPEEKEQAEKDAAKTKARQIIQRTADKLHGYRYEFIALNSNYCVQIHGNVLEIYAYYQVGNANVYFSSRELAEKCLELCRKEYEILLGVKE